MKLKYLWSYPVYAIFSLVVLMYLYLYLTPKFWVLKRRLNPIELDNQKDAYGFVLHELNKWARAVLLDSEG
jgi:hypothetical protein